ncbi:10640_t:CDS:2 [Acaulospora morrowiae]|uniref:10640_t:CDS:1 n=1 Tax=Acaulospora morrowiae TaxID=94023 RepID=A0A9N9BNV3_9GLOM|nr:10640_t:CDS:2 [Acaulospora morrowiae]
MDDFEILPENAAPGPGDKSQASNSLQDSKLSSSPSKSQDFENTFELIDSPNEPNAAPTGNKIKKVTIKEDLVNDNLLVFPILPSTQNEGESDTYLSSDSSGNSENSRRVITKSRNFKRHQFNIPFVFRVMYVGENVPDKCKRGLFNKISESLSQIFWELAEVAIQPNEINLEKRHIICPVASIPEDGKFNFDCYEDSGVTLCEADLTNAPYNRVFDYLHSQFKEIKSDADLIDLCVVFIPPDVDNISTDFLSMMHKLQDKVTLFPIIALDGNEIYFKDEREEKRRAISKYLKENDIEIFIWKADQMIEDGKNGETDPRWVETVYTKKVLTIDDFISFDNEAVYEDLQLLRSRAIEFRKDRQRREREKRRSQRFGVLRDITIMCIILYVVYLFMSLVWHYAEWSVIPSDLAQSLHTVSRASLKTQNQNGPQTIPLDNGEMGPLIEVFQETSSRFTFEILNKKQVVNTRNENFEVVVTHYPRQVLGRHSVVELSNGKYSFDIDTTGALGDVKVEIKKNGQLVKVVPWSPKKKDNEKPKDTSIAEKTGSIYTTINDATLDISQKINNVYEIIKDGLHKTAIYVGNELLAVFVYLGKHVPQVSKYVLDKVNLWVYYTLEIAENLANYTKDAFDYGVRRMKKGVFRMYRIVKHKFDSFGGTV